ncbi:hypothetical protein K466DRAFT_240053 [Polyporus arcularius HHB13444]|uniref:Uncharacterized protein n=1 Tax=Polyporus arcularius HHB13444 TaxID=1314778 RepID=A0A5C3PDL3_9APHY|nr:hypothetical protein K466DRAFT_240053 [Polyporus arcularius HHB13444]
MDIQDTLLTVYLAVMSGTLWLPVRRSLSTILQSPAPSDGRSSPGRSSPNARFQARSLRRNSRQTPPDRKDDPERDAHRACSVVLPSAAGSSIASQARVMFTPYDIPSSEHLPRHGAGWTCPVLAEGTHRWSSECTSHQGESPLHQRSPPSESVSAS